MDILSMGLIAIINSAAALILCLRAFGLNNVVKYGSLLDIVFSVAFVLAFLGTMGGMIIAALSAFSFSLMVTAATKLNSFLGA